MLWWWNNKLFSIWVPPIQGWEFAHWILERIARFLPKKWVIWAICSRLLISSERPERISQDRSLVLSDSLTLLRRNLLLFLKKFKKLQKTYKIFLSESLIFCEQKRKWAICSKKLSNSLICSFVLSFLSESLTFAHMSWATWVIRSQSLICPEQIPNPAPIPSGWKGSLFYFSLKLLSWPEPERW